jgi:hypothetical protein
MSMSENRKEQVRSMAQDRITKIHKRISLLRDNFEFVVVNRYRAIEPVPCWVCGDKRTLNVVVVRDNHGREFSCGNGCAAYIGAKGSAPAKTKPKTAEQMSDEELCPELAILKSPNNPDPTEL